MKILINLILGLLFFSSCTKETEFAHLYVIKNETSHYMEITGYDVIGNRNIRNTGDFYSDTIHIDRYSSYEVVRQAGWRLEAQSIFTTYDIDSLVIRFDSIKQILFSCDSTVGLSCCGKYNLMNIEENWVKSEIGYSSGKDEYSYTYTFTEDDYENAELINY